MILILQRKTSPWILHSTSRLYVTETTQQTRQTSMTTSFRDPQNQPRTKSAKKRREPKHQHQKLAGHACTQCLGGER